jgi:AmmeMemoRadiSam system protein A
MTEHHPLVKLARRSIAAFVREGKQIEPPEHLPAEMVRKAGAFVTIRLEGNLRGCIGTIEPVHDNLALEVIHNAIAAATRDTRFPPLEESELASIDVKVDVLTEPELVAGEEELDPKRYGLIVRSAEQPWRRGVLLPDLDGIDTVEKQVYWTRHHKAQITNPDEPVEMFRFEVQRLT